MKKVYLIKEITSEYDKKNFTKTYRGTINLHNQVTTKSHNNIPEEIIKKELIDNLRNYFYSNKMINAILELKTLALTTDIYDRDSELRKYDRVNELYKIIKEEMGKALPTDIESAEFISKED